MGNLFFIAGIILMVGWLVGYLGYNVGGAFHLLLIMAFIAILVSLIKGNKAL
ncbi:lmo0937 family membrane protein [Niastella caeni]|uniref:Lmo0937 family membrane protein n=2 Tax=Niastella caeni TaxID=2569763 RepID=A0A4S8HTX3_9BACT|nr:lmo0937 family membrane protein [Niastella caeni]